MSLLIKLYFQNKWWSTVLLTLILNGLQLNVKQFIESTLVFDLSRWVQQQLNVLEQVFAQIFEQALSM
jgi:hypothetical protein